MLDAVSEAANDEREFLKRLVIAHADIQQALSAITFLGEEVDEEAKYTKVELRRIKCFKTAFIVAYGRAFTSSKGRYDKLSLKKIGIRLTEPERELHELIIQLRQKVYAHSDEDYAHVRLDVWTMDMPSGSYAVPHMQFDHGLEFASFYKRDAAISLMRKIMHGLFRTVQALASRQPETSLYVQPSAKDPEPDWKEVAVQVNQVAIVRSSEEL
ncbi:hypothetical protein [Rhizobium sp. 'Codium 1']|uniref:hypothetical protein n=1 Tax=Rhizobium sp. 'Codium 1' TaxID=2940484 RepID=UPI001E61633E|nr:hypothetical protein [Rhizobium sp. 'Codium 1']MCC8934884.1 hypothetical protein [Rhizobium sp. 'Codium 1']